MRPVPAPGFQTTIQRRWLLSIGMAIVLLQSSIFALVDPDLSGWHPYHGHVVLGGIVAEHTHPWDREHRAPPALLHEHMHAQAGGPVEASGASPLFSASSLLQLGSVVGMALPGPGLLTAAAAAAAIASPMLLGVVPRSRFIEVPVPPPRS